MLPACNNPDTGDAIQAIFMTNRQQFVLSMAYVSTLD
jgi:hypothetical protein